jgi:hypothetical protein
MDTVSLTECIYEHIKDTFYYGLFGDFKLVIDKANLKRWLNTMRKAALQI